MGDTVPLELVLLLVPSSGLAAAVKPRKLELMELLPLRAMLVVADKFKLPELVDAVENPVNVTAPMAVTLAEAELVDAAFIPVSRVVAVTDIEAEEVLVVAEVMTCAGAVIDRPAALDELAGSGASRGVAVSPRDVELTELAAPVIFAIPGTIRDMASELVEAALIPVTKVLAVINPDVLDTLEADPAIAVGAVSPNPVELTELALATGTCVVAVMAAVVALVEEAAMPGI